MVLPKVLGASTLANYTHQELSDADDVASAVVVDPVLGFTTHKMNAKYRPALVSADYVRRVLWDLYSNDDLDAAYERLSLLPYVRAAHVKLTTAAKKVRGVDALVVLSD